MNNYRAMTESEWKLFIETASKMNNQQLETAIKMLERIQREQEQSQRENV